MRQTSFLEHDNSTISADEQIDIHLQRAEGRVGSANKRICVVAGLGQDLQWGSDKPLVVRPPPLTFQILYYIQGAHLLQARGLCNNREYSSSHAGCSWLPCSLACSNNITVYWPTHRPMYSVKNKMQCKSQLETDKNS